MPRIRRVRRARRALLMVLVVVVALVGLLVVGRIVRAHRETAGAPAPATSVASAKVTMAYGSSADQVYDVWPAQGASGPSPLVMFVHGGGWTSGSKDSASGPYTSSYYPAEGYAYASINYRLVPSVTVEDEASDVATALKSLLDHASELGIDPSRVVIMGHSAGAHLVALVGTDESYLAKVGLAESSLRGVIAIDGAAYDVPTQLEFGGIMHDRYVEAFGSDPVRQRALSPTAQAAAPNAPAFLLPHVQRPDGIAQAASPRRASSRQRFRLLVRPRRRPASQAQAWPATRRSTGAWAIRPTPRQRSSTPGSPRSSPSSRSSSSRAGRAGRPPGSRGRLRRRSC